MHTFEYLLGLTKFRSHDFTYEDDDDLWFRLLRLCTN